MSQISSVTAQRAEENRAYLRMLLWERQPAFAAALASAEQYLSCLACQGRRLNQDDDRQASTETKYRDKHEARCLAGLHSTH